MSVVRSFCVAFVPFVASAVQAADLKDVLKEKLPLFGHRNWIVIADAACPVHVCPAVETVYVGGDQPEAVATTLKTIRAAKNVRAHALLDAEFADVPKSDAPGVGHFRDQLAKLLAPQGLEQTPEHFPHEAILAELDETAERYQALILKTDFTIPYTSVFLRLNWGSWSPEAEQRLRKALRDKSK